MVGAKVNNKSSAAKAVVVDAGKLDLHTLTLGIDSGALISFHIHLYQFASLIRLFSFVSGSLLKA